MLVKNQKVEMKWNNRNKKSYLEKGYNFTKNGDVFYVDISDLTKGSHAKVDAICDFCNEKYNIEYRDYIKNIERNNNKFHCYRCANMEYKKKYDSNRGTTKNTLSYEEVESIVNSKNNNILLNSDDYINMSTKNLKIICGCCGEEFVTSLASIKSGDGLCKKCGIKKYSNSQKLSIAEVERRINSVNGNVLLNPNDYIKYSECNLKIKCGECGDIFYTSLANYEYFQKIRCDKCSQKISIPERKTMEFLEKNNIFYKYNYTFNGCKDKRLLPFDFFLEKYNLIIEIDGEHHYHPKWGEEQFKMIKYHDGIKNKYCEDNEIKLLRIPFWNFENLEEIISEELKIENPKFSKILKMKYIPRYKYNKTNEYKIA